MCLQTEKDVLKNKIKKINLQHNVEMFSTNERDIKHLLQNGTDFSLKTASTSVAEISRC